MANVWFLLGLFHEGSLGEHLEHSDSGDIYNVQLAEKVFFILLVYLSLTDENMVE